LKKEGKYSGLGKYQTSKGKIQERKSIKSRTEKHENGWKKPRQKKEKVL